MYARTSFARRSGRKPWDAGSGRFDGTNRCSTAGYAQAGSIKGTEFQATSTAGYPKRAWAVFCRSNCEALFVWRNINRSSGHNSASLHRFASTNDWSILSSGAMGDRLHSQSVLLGLYQASMLLSLNQAFSICFFEDRYFQLSDKFP